MHLPTRDETHDMLVALVDGRRSPEDVADRAQPFVIEDATQPDDGDRAVWATLVRLSGADLRSSPGIYLHSASDYASWLADFRRA